MTPIERVTQKVGDIEKVAKMARVSVPRVRRWSFPKERGGTNGHVPAKRMRMLLSAAKELGIDLLPSDFFEVA